MSNVYKISGPIKVGNSSSAPSNPENGFIYYDTTLDKFRMYQNGSFVSAADLTVLGGSSGATLIGFNPTGLLNIGGGATTVKAAVDALDAAIGALAASPTNYTPVDPDVVASHLAAIDAALATAGSVEYDDSTFRIYDNGDNTKKIAFEASGIATGTTRTITMPNAAVNLGQVNTSIQQDGSRTFTADQSMGGNKLTNVAAGTASSDAVNRGQLDAVLEGLKPKTAVRAATTANITIATALNSGDVIDGVTLANGDRILVKDQTAAEQNGIYIVSATPTRSTDFDSTSPIDEINGAMVAVEEGTANAGKVYVQSGATVTTIDTDPINFVYFNSSASLVGGDGITVSGSNISVDHDGEGLTFVSNQLALELDGSTLNKSASGVKVATAGITNNEVATGIDAAKIADGSVSNAEFQFINSLTSNAQTQLDGKSSTTLNNLGTTSINSDLLPSVTATRNIGSSSLRWSTIHTGTTSVYSSLGLFNSGGTQRGQLLAELAMPSGNTANAAFRSIGATSILGIWSDSNTTSAATRVETGNASAGASGDIILQTGTATTTRGNVILNGNKVQLQTDIETGANAIEAAANPVLLAGQNSVRRAKQASKTNFVEEEYIHSTTLSASQTGTVITALTFAYATYEGMEITYKMKEATSNDVRIGTFRVVTNGSAVSYVDTSTETADTGITLLAAINGANVEISYNSGANAVTLRMDIKRILA